MMLSMYIWDTCEYCIKTDLRTLPLIPNVLAVTWAFVRTADDKKKKDV